MDQLKIAVGYVRYSSKNQSELSIVAQKNKIEAFALKNGYTILRYYEDHAKTGTSTLKRTAFNQMIADSYGKEFQFSIVHKLDRFGRSRLDAMVNRAKLSDNGVSLISVEEDLVLKSSHGVIIESVLEGLAEFYSKNLSNEVKKTMEIRAKDGLHNGGKPPLGFDVDKVSEKLVINQYEAEAVKLIFNMYIDGHSYNEIIKVLSNKGYKTKLGNDFKKNSLHDLLKNRKYVGIQQYNAKTGKSAFGKRNNHSYKSDAEIITVDCPRIISDTLFQSVQEKMKSNRKCTGEYKAKENYLLSGKVICGECGCKFTGSSRTSGRNKKLYVTYRCSGRDKNNGCSNKEINKVYLETFVLKQLKNVLYPLKRIEYTTSKINQFGIQENDQFDIKIKGYRNQLNGVDTKIQNILTSIENGVTDEMLLQRLNELKHSKVEIKKQIDIAYQENLVPTVTEEQVKKALKKFKNIALKGELHGIKKLIAEYVEQVVVYNDRVEVIYKAARKISDKYTEVC